MHVKINDLLHLKRNQFPEINIPTCLNILAFVWAFASTDYNNKKCQTTKIFTKITKFPP